MKFDVIKQFLLLLLSSIGCEVVSAQETFPKAEIHYPSNNHNLSAQSIISIDSAVSLLVNIPPAYNVAITGHADNTGSPAFNKRLSYNRAKEVANYLTGKKFRSRKINATGKGDNEPVTSNDTEEGKALNRRTVIDFELKLQVPSNIGGLSLPDNRFNVDNSKGGTFKYHSGTRLFVPPSAFVDETGLDVLGDISLQYREYRNPVDFILRGIPMSIMTDGNLYHFNSAGMFEILAFKNNKPVYLKPGKTIDIGFVTTRLLPNMNFYRFDTLEHKWAEMAKLTSTGSGQSRGMSCGFVNGEKRCFMDDCLALDMIMNVGIRFSKSNSTITDNLGKLDSLRTVKKNINESSLRNDGSLKSINEGLNQQKHYKVYQQPTSKSYTLFTVQKKSPSNATESSLFDELTFRLKTRKNIAMPDLVFNKEWQAISFSDSLKSGRYNIHFVSDDTTINYRSVEIIADKKMSRRERKQYNVGFVNKIDSITEQEQNFRMKLLKSRDALLQENDMLNRNRSSLQFLFDDDSLFCFWDKSRQLMDSAEKTMKFETWLKYFDEHKPEMLNRYSSLKSGAKYQYCLDLVSKKQEFEMRQQKANAMTSTANKVASEVVQSLSIAQLGIYNCDQLMRLNNPVEVFADYVDTKGKQLEIVIIYILDQTLNGMLMYDGHYGFSPYRFAYSPSSRTSMIAIDEYGNSYVFSPKSFGEIVQAKLKNKYTFKLTKIEKLSSREKLQELLY